MKLESGLYELLVNNEVDEAISLLEDRFKIDIQEVDKADSHYFLARNFSKILTSVMSEFKDESKLDMQIKLYNDLIEVIQKYNPNYNTENLYVENKGNVLRKIRDKISQEFKIPETSLSIGTILTANNGDPTLVSQLRAEFLNSDRVDILVSFIKWSGIRMLQEELIEFTKRGKLRVITTSYMGATDYKAIEFLNNLPNTEIKISYDTKRTRLHAKAYIFHRNSGFGASYIGSSNISNPAMTDGLEWNVKVCEYESLFLWNKINANFESYQNSNEFDIYCKSKAYKLQNALKREKTDSDQFFTFFDINPYPYQSEILDKLKADREIHNRFRNLVVAATGTGKTIIAAFDYKRQINSIHKPKLLFVAHRKEILQQSRVTFRQVLKDQNFGELWVGDSKPRNFEHLFVSIQTLNSQELYNRLDNDYYDYIVVDEFHHAAAKSYRAVLNYFTPKLLLGLTATPYRHDGIDILNYFDGQISSEIRLTDAINRKLLSPFQYFGVTDHSSVNYSNIKWQAGHYKNSEIERLLTGNDARAQLIIDKTNDILLDVKQSRGLCFCVSQKHAEYMANKFNEANIPSIALTSKSDNETRDSVKKKLISCQINFICVVDLFNEGVDIPEIDTVIFLRPTESLTVFLQQLGRGLRFSDGKDGLTVLDFIGQAHRKFNFEDRFKALIGYGNRSVKKEIKNCFPNLPSGCYLKLEKQAKEYILKNIEQSISNVRRNQLVQRIRDFKNDFGLELTLKNFLDKYNLTLKDLYKKRHSWARLCVEAGIKNNFYERDEEAFTKGLRRFVHQNCYQNLDTLIKVLNDFSNKDNKHTLLIEEQLLVNMFLYSIWQGKPKYSNISDNIRALQENPILYRELIEVIVFLKESVDSIVYKPVLPYKSPLYVHAQYTRDEILAGLGLCTLEKTPSVREGVKYIKEIKTDVFFITLNKSEKDYSPTTMYEDYAINEDLFHWQSQSNTSEDSPTGKRYINHKQMGVTVLLFVREFKSDGLACPYYFLGEADYVQHEGSRPMSIIWKLKNKIPSKLIRKTSRVNSA